MKTSMSRSTFKILFYVKKGSERANGYLPLMCRLTVDGEIKQFSCKLDVPPKLWDMKTVRATGKSAEAQKINAAVDRIRVDKYSKIFSGRCVSHNNYRRRTVFDRQKYFRFALFS